MFDNWFSNREEIIIAVLFFCTHKFIFMRNTFLVTTMKKMAKIGVHLLKL